MNPKITPEQERLNLKSEIIKSPEKTGEIIEDYTRQQPEDIYDEQYHLSSEQKAAWEKDFADPNLVEKEQVIERIFNVAQEKGILNAVQLARKLDSSVMDEFHDRLILYLHSQQ